jgi:hypothetical protein
MTLRVALWMLFLSLSCPSIMRGQSQPKVQTDIDPLALDVLRAANQPISSAKSYSFKTVIGEEHLGTNNQVITLFHVTEAVVQQPDGVGSDPLQA